MANKAISELPQALNVNNQDLFVLEQSGIAKKLTAETFITEQGIIDALAEALDGHGGITSVTLSSVSGRIRTYLITFTDETTTTFQVLDGTSIDRIVKTSTAGLTDTYTVFMNDGTTTFFTVTNGADGSVSEAMLNDALKNKAPVITETTESSAIATFSDGADDMVMHNVIVEINPVQDLSNGDPSPSNICPISGHTEVNVFIGDIAPLEFIDGKYYDDNGVIHSSSNTRYETDYISVESNGEYYFVFDSTSTNRLRVHEYDANKTWLRQIINTFVNSTVISYTASADASYIRYSYPIASGDSQICRTIINVPLGGTYYGGTIDVATGLLTVTDANIASYAGETLPLTWISDRDVYAEGTTPTMGAQVVYKLATPQTYQLTPQQLLTFLGTNSVWADTGNTTVTYPADTKMYIQNLTQPTEDDLVANQAITSGQYFMIGNSLYLALANIASGAQITIGTNAQRVSLADALNAINS